MLSVDASAVPQRASPKHQRARDMGRTSGMMETATAKAAAAVIREGIDTTLRILFPKNGRKLLDQ